MPLFALSRSILPIRALHGSLQLLINSAGSFRSNLVDYQPA
jgi:hypothetical protein